LEGAVVVCGIPPTDEDLREGWLVKEARWKAAESRGMLRDDEGDMLPTGASELGATAERPKEEGVWMGDELLGGGGEGTGMFRSGRSAVNGWRPERRQEDLKRMWHQGRPQVLPIRIQGRHQVNQWRQL
jgi:hypothetical protein